MSNVSETRTLRDALRVVFRRWPLFLVGASVFAVTVIYWAHEWPLSYTGTAMFERTLEPAAAGLKVEEFSPLKRTLIQRLRGREAVEKVIEELELTKGMPHGPDGRLTEDGEMEKQELVEKFRQGLKVTFPVQSERIDLVSVEFTHQAPDLAQKVPNLLAGNYITWAYAKIRTGLESNRAFLEKQVRNCKNRIVALEAEENLFKMKNAGMFPEDPDALQDRISEIRTNLETRRLQLKRVKEELAQLESLSGTATETKDAPEPEVTSIELEYVRLKADLQDLQVRLLDLNDQLTAAQLEYTNRHPTVRALLDNISFVKAKIKLTETNIKVVEPKLPPRAKGQRSPASAAELASYRAALARAQSEGKNLTEEVERLEKVLGEYNDRQKTYPVVRQQYLRIVNDIKEQRGETLRWETRYNDVRMALETQEAQLHTRLDILQTAQKQFRPSSPKLAAILGFAFVGGLGFGTALVLLFNFLDRSIRTTEEATDYFNVPVHGVIGEIVTSRSKLKKRVRRWVVMPAVTLVILAVLALSTLSITLWLKAPEKFEEWRSAPVSFVYDHTVTLMDNIWQRFRS